MATADRLRRAINQYEATTGRRVTKQALQALIEGELASDRALATDNARMEIYNKELDLKEQALKDEASAAKVSGLTQLAGTGATAAYMLKDTRFGKAVGDKVAGVFSKPAVTGPVNQAVSTGLTATGASAVPSMIPATTKAFTPFGSSSLAWGSTAGLETGAAAGAGAAATSSGAGVTAIGAAEGAGSAAAGATAAGSGLMAVAAPVGYGFLTSGVMQALGFNEDISNTAGGALAGAMIGGPIGAVIGGGIGSILDNVFDGTVICSELHRQGLLPKRILVYDAEYKHRFIDDATYHGYLTWAEPVVKAMRKSKVITRLMTPIGRAWAYEMAHVVNPSIKGSFFGKALLKLSVYVSRKVGESRGMVWAS